MGAATCADETTGAAVDGPDGAATVFDDAATPAYEAASTAVDFLDWAAFLELEAETATASASPASALRPSRADEPNLFFTRAKK